LSKLRDPVLFLATSFNDEEDFGLAGDKRYKYKVNGMWLWKKGDYVDPLLERLLASWSEENRERVQSLFLFKSDEETGRHHPPCHFTSSCYVDDVYAAGYIDNDVHLIETPQITYAI
jgi:hypothetical protein